MTRFLKHVSAWLLCMTCLGATAQKQQPAFTIVPLGVKGGIDESNLSAYLLAAGNSNDFICLDAGTLHFGIQQAIKKGSFKVSAETVLKQYIKGYFISHAHLDHVSGLIINSPEDSTKNIYGLAQCLQTIKTHYFTWQSWANFTNEGDAPHLKKYSYHPLEPGDFVNIAGINLQARIFPLSHSNLTSAALLVKNSNDAYALYLGDTGPDEVEKSSRLRELWQYVAPLIKDGSLKAIMIEVSFPNEQSDKTLFGHLTPNWFYKEMQVLASYSSAEALKRVNIVITHVKPPEAKIEQIKYQLRQQNTLGLKLVFPEQGKRLNF